MKHGWAGGAADRPLFYCSYYNPCGGLCWMNSVLIVNDEAEIRGSLEEILALGDLCRPEHLV